MEQSLTRFRLIRHGHVDTGPPPGRLCGWLDLPLSPKGRGQLQALREGSLLGEVPDALYSSTLRRAREVAGALAEAWRLRERPVDALREIHCGRLEGMHIGDVIREYPDLWDRNRAQLDDDFTWPEGESYREFRKRVLTTLADIAAQHRGQQIAVVTHAGVIAQVLGAIKGRPAAVWEQDRPAPLTLTEVTWADGAPVSLVSFGVREWR